MIRSVSASIANSRSTIFHKLATSNLEGLLQKPRAAYVSDTLNQRSQYSRPLVLHQIGRRTSVIAASAFTASLSLSSAIASNLPFKEAGNASRISAVSPTNATVRVSTTEDGTVIGTIFDPNGAVIPNALVAISNADSKLAISTVTNDQGQYKFDGLAAGTYNLKVEAQGFAPSDVPNISVHANDENRIDQTLSIASIQEQVDVISELPQNQQTVVMGAAMLALPTELLVRAAQSDDLEAVKEVLLTKSDADVRDKSTGSTALEMAVRHANREMVQVLLWAKADVNARNNSGQTVLMMLGEKITSDIVWDLINAGAKVNLRDEDGDTALLEAARSNNMEVLKTLLDAGAKVNARNNNSQTALMLAASEGLINNLKTLILAGGDINAHDNEGKTAFLYAKENDQSPIVRLLRSYGVDESVQTK
jgi:ankyrin repeat protein